jgi:hypothetical protein
MDLKVTLFAAMEDIKPNAMAELQNFRKEAFCRCLKNGRFDEASICMLKGPTFFFWRSNLFAISNNTFSKWWEVKDGM